MKFTLTKKTGFEVLDAPIRILDFRKKLFYDTSLIKNVRKFNLPEGVYYLIRGAMRQTDKPRVYDLPKLPQRERKNYPKPYGFKIVFASNPNKASIFWNRKRIVFDHSLRQKSIPQLMFILYHEYGHCLYSSEHLADLFAVREMLRKGYNPSQIGTAPLETLSAKQFFRKKYVVDQLTSV